MEGDLTDLGLQRAAGRGERPSRDWLPPRQPPQRMGRLPGPGQKAPREDAIRRVWTILGPKARAGDRARGERILWGLVASPTTSRKPSLTIFAGLST